MLSSDDQQQVDASLNDTCASDSPTQVITMIADAEQVEEASVMRIPARTTREMTLNALIQLRDRKGTSWAGLKKQIEENNAIVLTKRRVNFMRAYLKLLFELKELDNAGGDYFNLRNRFKLTHPIKTKKKYTKLTNHKQLQQYRTSMDASTMTPPTFINIIDDDVQRAPRLTKRRKPDIEARTPRTSRVNSGRVTRSKSLRLKSFRSAKTSTAIKVNESQATTTTMPLQPSQLLFRTFTRRFEQGTAQPPDDRSV